MLKIRKLTMLATLAALAVGLAACGSSDGGPSQAELDAAEAARAAAEAEAEAARQEAEAARQAAEEAAAQARQEAIAEQQKQSVMAAIAAATASVAALMDDSSDADLAGAMAEIARATAAIAAATSLTEAEAAMYTSQVTLVQADLDLASANVRAYRAEQEAEAAQNRATAADRAKEAVDDASTALDMATEAQTMAQTAYEAAVATQAAAQTAVANADSETLADASAALAAALINSASAAADLGVKTQAVTDARAALQAAADTLAEVDPDHVLLQEANAKLAQAATDAQAQAAKIKALEDEIARMKQAEADQAKEDKMEAMAAAGKALKAALGADPIGHLSAASLAATGLTITPGDRQTDGTIQPGTAFAELTAVKGSEGTLGEWKSMSYSHTNTGTKVTNEAMVYTNQKDPTREAFATGATFGADQSTFDTAYTATTRTLALGANLAGGTDIAGNMFPTAGTTNYTPTAPSNENIIPGTYQGAPGDYRCTGATGCGATATAGGGVTLVGTWTFTHHVGAMVSVSDPTYLYFGWWLNSNKDGPVEASAFAGEFGDVEGGGTFTNPLNITGSATYAGEAAGKFAISHPINGGDAGHFTADATLTAKFGPIASPNNGGISGTISDFRLNDGSEDPGWSVSLNHAAWGQEGAFASTATAGDNIANGTTWSIDGNAAAESGRWSGQMYDEALAPATANDGSNVPTSVAGVFQSHFGSDHTLVGGFGAEK